MIKQSKKFISIKFSNWQQKIIKVDSYTFILLRLYILMTLSILENFGWLVPKLKLPLNETATKIAKVERYNVTH